MSVSAVPIDAFAALAIEPPKSIVDVCMEDCGLPRDVAHIVEGYIVTKTVRLFQDVNAIRYQVPNGRADPADPCSALTERADNRTYVLQRATHCHDTSPFDAFDMIRFCIGKNAQAELRAQRVAEVACLRYRKEHIEFCTTYREAFPYFLNPLTFAILHNETRESIAAEMVKSEAQGVHVPYIVRHFIAPTQTNHERLIDFWNWYRTTKGVENDVNFIRNQNYTPQAAFALMGQMAPYQEWDQLIASVNSENPIAKVLYSIVIVASARLYQLSPSTWDSRDPIDRLVTALKEKGPLVIQGVFGRSCYVDEPIRLTESTAKQEVLGWKPGNKLPRMGFECIQAITVVGAQKEKNDAQYVYYVDPFDASDPASGTRRKLYKISYRSLQENVTAFSPGVFAYSSRV